MVELNVEFRQEGGVLCLLLVSRLKALSCHAKPLEEEIPKLGVILINTKNQLSSKESEIFTAV